MGLGLLNVCGRPRVEGIVVELQVRVDVVQGVEEVGDRDGAIVEAASWWNMVWGMF